MPGPVLPTIDVTEADRRLREDPARPLLVDVREADEFDDGAGAGRRARPDVGVRGARRGAAEDRPLLMICHLGGRSAAATGFLLRSGRTDVVNVAGGMDAWERAGLPVASRRAGTGRGRPPGLAPGGRSPSRTAARSRRDALTCVLVGERPADEQQDR